MALHACAVRPIGWTLSMQGTRVRIPTIRIVMHEKFQLAQSRRQFARLLKFSQEQEKALEENPRPFLDKAYAEVAKYRKLLDDIRAAASGLSTSPPAPGKIEYESIESSLLKRLRKIEELLRGADQPEGNECV